MGAWLMPPSEPPVTSLPAFGALVPVPAGALVVPEAPPAPPVRLSLIIPTFNEARNIEGLIQRLTELLDGPLAGSYELVVVDDDSPDRTWEKAASLAPR